MGTQIFLGKPPANIEQWIRDHHGPSDDWTALVKALENGASDSNPVTFRGSTLNVGSRIGNVQYKMDDNSDQTVGIAWKVLGYNASIPEYIKYKNGSDYVFVPSMVDGLLTSFIISGRHAFTREYNPTTGDFTYTDAGEVQNISTQDFTYGNNCTFSVPMSVVVGGKEYAFCGYNVTIQTEGLLLDTTPNANTTITHVYFDNANYKNRYGIAPIRDVLNDIAGTALAYHGGGSSGDYTMKSLAFKFQDEDGFLRNIQKTVNRTWVHEDWRSGATLDSNYCEHVVDKFWSLGNGNVNCSGQSGGTTYLMDGTYDTSKFSSIYSPADDMYQENSSRIKYFLNPDGSVGSSSDDWWLRSANPDTPHSLSNVLPRGGVDSSGAYNCYALSPACQIG